MAGTGVDTREIIRDKTTFSSHSAQPERKTVESQVVVTEGTQAAGSGACVCEKGTPEPNLGGQEAVSQQVHPRSEMS